MPPMNTSTSRARTALAVALIVVGAWLGSARALRAETGMELLLTDSRARSLVGYGLLLGDTLTLRLSTRIATLTAVIAHPDGRVGQWHAELQQHRLWLYDDDAGWIDLASLLAQDDVALRFMYDDGVEVRVEPLPGSFPPGIGPGPPRPVPGEPTPTPPGADPPAIGPRPDPDPDPDPPSAASLASQSSTEAARVCERVKAPASVVPGTSAASITSVLPL